MASQYDLGNEGMKRFQAILEIYRSKRGVVSAPEQSKLVELYKDYGEEILRDAVVNCCLSHWHFVGQINRLCGFYKIYGKPRVDHAIERLQGRQNFSQDMLEKILKDRSLEQRETKASGQQPVLNKKAITYPTPDGVYDRYHAQLWLTQKGYPIEEAMVYFDNAGTAPSNNSPLYKLKSEYR